MNGVRVNTDGTVTKFTTDKPIYEYLGFWIEIVRTKMPKVVAIVDEEGLLKWKKPNRLGTLISGYPNTLVGDMLFMKEDFTEEGPDLVPMTEEELTTVYNLIMNFIETNAI